MESVRRHYTFITFFYFVYLFSGIYHSAVYIKNDLKLHQVKCFLNKHLHSLDYDFLLEDTLHLLFTFLFSLG